MSEFDWCRTGPQVFRVSLCCDDLHAVPVLWFLLHNKNTSPCGMSRGCYIHRQQVSSASSLLSMLPGGRAMLRHTTGGTFSYDQLTSAVCFIKMLKVWDAMFRQVYFRSTVSRQY